MKKTVCEMFAGVGGFRCGLNGISRIGDAKKNEKWETVWFNQWEPNKKKQWAHDCYVHRFGTVFDRNGKDSTNLDIAVVNKAAIPDHTLLVGGFPCQDYSVAHSGAQGIQGKKGVLWWSILDVIREKKTPFILLENVDRLLKSPSKQRGRDFGVILACLRSEGYLAEWRVINAADYGYPQRRRRIFLFACRKDTKYARTLLAAVHQNRNAAKEIMERRGFFAQSFPVELLDDSQDIDSVELSQDIVQVSDSFTFSFENTGFMADGIVFTGKTIPQKHSSRCLGDILEANKAADHYFIPDEKLYYTAPTQNHSDETEELLPDKCHKTWQYIKGAKRLLRTTEAGFTYVYSEGPVPMVDEWNTPARTMLTSEGSFSRCTHLVKDRETEGIRLLTPIEAERLQGFPDNWTKDCLINGAITPMTERMRYFCMGNALVVGLIAQMEPVLSRIVDTE